MSDGQVPAPASKGMNPVVKWLLIGCGGLVLLMILAMGTCAFISYRVVKNAQHEIESKTGGKIDTSHGIQGFAYSAATSSVQGMKPMMLMTLPKEEQPGAAKAFDDLAAKGGRFNPQDMNDLNLALQRYNEAIRVKTQAGQPAMDTDASRAFVKDIQAIADRH